MLQQDLKKFGFPKNLAKVYIALYKKGESKARDIIEETGLHRNIVYNNLDKLIDKNLATKKKEGHVKVFQALNPERVREEIKRKEELADSIVEKLKTIREPQEQSVVIREGVEELKEKLFELYEQMEADETWKTLGMSGIWFENILSNEEHEELIALQEENKFNRKVATPEVIEAEKEHQNKLPDLNQHEILPEFTSRENEIHILEDKVINTILVEPYTIMEISNPKVVESYNNFFERLWNQEVFTYKGWEEVKNVYYEILPPAIKNDEDLLVIASFSQNEEVITNQMRCFLILRKSGEIKKI